METFLSLMLLLPILNIVFSTLFLPSIFFSHLGLSPALTPAVPSLDLCLKSPDGKNWCFTPKVPNHAAPTKGFVALPLEEAQKE